MGVNVSYIEKLLEDSIVGFGSTEKFPEDFKDSPTNNLGPTSNKYNISTSINDSYLVVGVPNYSLDNNGANSITSSGIIFIFARKGDTWQYYISISAPTRTANEQYGYSVSISENNTLVVGTNGSKKAYIYDFATSFVYSTTLTGLDATYGNTVFALDNNVFVGNTANNTDNNSNTTAANAGAVFVYNKNQNWAQTQKITLANGDVSNNDMVGSYIAYDSNFYYVSSTTRSYDIDNNNYLAGSGIVYVLQFSNNQFNLYQKLQSPARYTKAAFGTKIVPSTNGIYISDARNVYYYSYNGTTFSYLASIFDITTQGKTTNVVNDFAADDNIYVSYNTFLYGYSFDGTKFTTLNSGNTIDTSISNGIFKSVDTKDDMVLYSQIGLSSGTSVKLSYYNSSTDKFSTPMLITGSGNDRNSGDSFGQQCYINTTTNQIMISAPLHSYDINSQNYVASAGALYVWNINSDNSLSFSQKLVSSSRTASAKYGSVVSTAKNLMVIATNVLNSNANVDVYTFTSGTWTYSSTITAGLSWILSTDGNAIIWDTYSSPNTTMNVINNYNIDKTTVVTFNISSYRENTQQFYASVNNGKALISFPSNSTDMDGANSISNAGSSCVFSQQENGSWSFYGKIVGWGQDRNINDNFGYSIKSQNNYLYISSHNSYDVNSRNYILNAGKVYIFMKQTSDTYAYVQSIVSPNRASLGFGYEIECSSDNQTLIVSGGLSTYFANIYIYKLQNNSYAYDQTITTKFTSSNLGTSIWLFNDNLLFAAVPNQGVYSYIYSSTNNTWTLDNHFTRNDITQTSYNTNDLYGFSLDYADNTLVIGAPNDNYNSDGTLSFGTYSGSAYVYSRIANGSTNSWIPMQKLAGSTVNNSRQANDHLGGSITRMDDMIIAAALENSYDVNGKNYILNSGSVYVFTINDDGTQSLLQKITEPTRKASASFGISIKTVDNRIYIQSLSLNVYEYTFDSTTSTFNLTNTINFSSHITNQNNNYGSGNLNNYMAVSENFMLIGGYYYSTKTVYNVLIYVRNDDGSWSYSTDMYSISSQSNYTGVYINDNYISATSSSGIYTIIEYQNGSFNLVLNFSPDARPLISNTVANVYYYEDKAFFTFTNGHVLVYDFDGTTFKFSQILQSSDIVSTTKKYSSNGYGSYGYNIKADGNNLVLSYISASYSLLSDSTNAQYTNAGAAIVYGNLQKSTQNNTYMNGFTADGTYTVPDNAVGEIKFHLFGGYSSSGYSTNFGNYVSFTDTAVPGTVYEYFIATNGKNTLTSYNGVVGTTSTYYSGAASVIRKNGTIIAISGGAGMIANPYMYNTQSTNTYLDGKPEDGKYNQTGGAGYRYGSCSNISTVSPSGLNYIDSSVTKVEDYVSELTPAKPVSNLVRSSFSLGQDGGIVIENTLSETTEKYTFVQDITPTTPLDFNSSDQFGVQFDIKDDLLVISSMLHDYDSTGQNAGNLTNTGAAWIYNYTTSWQQTQKITPTGKNARNTGDQFGNAIKIFNGSIVVSSIHHAYGKQGQYLTAATNSIGAAWVWDLVDNTWTQVDKISPGSTEMSLSGTTMDSYSNSSISVIAVGSSSTQNGVVQIAEDKNVYDWSDYMTNAGAVYILSVDSNNVITPVSKIVSPNREAGAYFGVSISFNKENGKLYVGENYSTSTSVSGNVYEFTMGSDETLWNLTNTITPTTNNSNIFGFGTTLAINDNKLAITAPQSNNLSLYDTSKVDSYINIFTNGIFTSNTGGIIINFLYNRTNGAVTRLFEQVDISATIDIDHTDPNNAKIILNYFGTHTLQTSQNIDNGYCVLSMYGNSSGLLFHLSVNGVNVGNSSATLTYITSSDIAIFGNNNAYNNCDSVKIISITPNGTSSFNSTYDMRYGLLINSTNIISHNLSPIVFTPTYSLKDSSGKVFVYDISTTNISLIQEFKPSDFNILYNGTGFGYSVDIDDNGDMVIGYYYDKLIDGINFNNIVSSSNYYSNNNFPGSAYVYTYNSTDKNYSFSKRIGKYGNDTSYPISVSSTEYLNSTNYEQYPSLDDISTLYASFPDPTGYVKYNTNGQILYYNTNNWIHIVVFVPEASSNKTRIFTQGSYYVDIDCSTSSPVVNWSGTNYSIAINKGAWNIISIGNNNGGVYVFSNGGNINPVYSIYPTDTELFIGPNSAYSTQDILIYGGVAHETVYNPTDTTINYLPLSLSCDDYTYGINQNSSLGTNAVINFNSVSGVNYNNTKYFTTNSTKSNKIVNISNNTSIAKFNPLSYNVTIDYIKNQKNVSTYGDYVFVGHETDNYDYQGYVQYTNSGAVHIWKKDPTTETYKFVQRLTSPNRNNNSYFGKEIKCFSDTIIVSAPMEQNISTHNINNGNLYIYKNTGTSPYIWELDSSVELPFYYTGQNLGMSFDYDYINNLVVVGDPNYVDTTNGIYGRVYVLQKNSNSEWSVIQTITPTDSTNLLSTDKFGENIEISSGTVMVTSNSNVDINGNIYDTNLSNYVYSYDNGKYSFIQKLLSGNHYTYASGGSISFDISQLSSDEFFQLYYYQSINSFNQFTAFDIDGVDFYINYDNNTQSLFDGKYINFQKNSWDNKIVINSSYLIINNYKIAISSAKKLTINCDKNHIFGQLSCYDSSNNIISQYQVKNVSDSSMDGDATKFTILSNTLTTDNSTNVSQLGQSYYEKQILYGYDNVKYKTYVSHNAYANINSFFMQLDLSQINITNGFPFVFFTDTSNNFYSYYGNEILYYNAAGGSVVWTAPIDITRPYIFCLSNGYYYDNNNNTKSITSFVFNSGNYYLYDSGGRFPVGSTVGALILGYGFSETTINSNPTEITIDQKSWNIYTPIANGNCDSYFAYNNTNISTNYIYYYDGTPTYVASSLSIENFVHSHDNNLILNGYVNDNIVLINKKNITEFSIQNNVYALSNTIDYSNYTILNQYFDNSNNIWIQKEDSSNVITVDKISTDNSIVTYSTTDTTTSTNSFNMKAITDNLEYICIDSTGILYIETVDSTNLKIDNTSKLFYNGTASASNSLPVKLSYSNNILEDQLDELYTNFYINNPWSFSDTDGNYGTFYSQIGKSVYISNGNILASCDYDVYNETKVIGTIAGYYGTASSHGSQGSVITLFKNNNNFYYSTKIVGNNPITTTMAQSGNNFPSIVKPLKYNNNLYIEAATVGNGIHLCEITLPSTINQVSSYTYSDTTLLDSNAVSKFVTIGWTPTYNNKSLNFVNDNLYTTLSSNNQSIISNVQSNSVWGTSVTTSLIYYDLKITTSCQFGSSMVVVNDLLLIGCPNAGNSNTGLYIGNNTYGASQTTGCIYVYDTSKKIKTIIAVSPSMYSNSGVYGVYGDYFGSIITQYGDYISVSSDGNIPIARQSTGTFTYFEYSNVTDSFSFMDYINYSQNFTVYTYQTSYSYRIDNNNCIINIGCYNMSTKNTITYEYSEQIGSANVQYSSIFDSNVRGNTVIKGNILAIYKNYFAMLVTINGFYFINVYSYENNNVTLTDRFMPVTNTIANNDIDCNLSSKYFTLCLNDSTYNANILSPLDTTNRTYMISDEGKVVIDDYVTSGYSNNTSMPIRLYCDGDYYVGGFTTYSGVPYEQQLTNSGGILILKKDSNLNRYSSLVKQNGAYPYNSTSGGSGGGYYGGWFVPDTARTGQGGTGGYNYAPSDWKNFVSTDNVTAPENGDLDQNSAATGGIYTSSTSAGEGHPGQISIVDSNGLKTAYGYTGYDQTYTVPTGVTSITVKIWGAGGGAAQYNSTYPTSSGGAGGFVSGTITVQPSQILTLIVGQGGMSGTTFASNIPSTSYNYGGGSYPYTVSQSSSYGGAGGGRSEIQLNGQIIATAGGGGGGGGLYYYSNNIPSPQNDGSCAKNDTLILPITGNKLLQLGISEFSPTINSQDYFGQSVIVYNKNKIFIGSPGHDYGLSGKTLSIYQSGAIFQYEMVSNAKTTAFDITGKINGSMQLFNFGSNIIKSNNSYIVGYNSVNNGYIFNYNSTTNAGNTLSYNINNYNQVTYAQYDQSFEDVMSYVISNNLIEQTVTKKSVAADNYGNIIFSDIFSSGPSTALQLNNSGTVYSLSQANDLSTTVNQSIIEPGLSSGRIANDNFGKLSIMYKNYILSVTARGRIYIYKDNGTSYNYDSYIDLSQQSYSTMTAMRMVNDIISITSSGMNIIPIILSNNKFQVQSTISLGSSTNQYSDIIYTGSALYAGIPSASQGTGNQPSITKAGQFMSSSNGIQTYYTIPGISNGIPATTDNFGNAVSIINNNLVVVGSPGHPYDYYGNTLTNTGAIYTFVIGSDRTSYSQETILSNNYIKTTYAGYGSIIKRVDNSTFVSGTASNIVSVMSRLSYNNWKSITTQYVPVNGKSDISYDGNILCVGNPTNAMLTSITTTLPYSLQANQGGMVYFNKANNWSNYTYITQGIPSIVSSAKFGSTIVASNNNLIIGAPTASIDNTGAVTKTLGLISVYGFNSVSGIAKYNSSVSDSNVVNFGGLLDISKDGTVFVTSGSMDTTNIFDIFKISNVSKLQQITTNSTSNISSIAINQKNTIAVGEQTKTTNKGIELYTINQDGVTWTYKSLVIPTDTTSTNVGAYISMNSQQALVYSSIGTQGQSSTGTVGVTVVNINNH